MCPNLETRQKAHYLVLFGIDVPYFLDKMGIMDEITLGRRAEFETWIRVIEKWPLAFIVVSRKKGAL